MWCGSVTYILLLLVSPKIGFTKNTSGNQPAAAWTKDTFPSSPLEPFRMLGYWHPKHFVNQMHFGFDCVSKLTSGPTRIWDSIRVTIQLEQAYMDSEEKLKCISLLTDPDVLLYYSIQKKHHQCLSAYHLVGNPVVESWKSDPTHVIPRAFGQVALNNKVCRSRGHSWTIPESQVLSSKPRCVFFLFWGYIMVYSTRLSRRFKRFYNQRI